MPLNDPSGAWLLGQPLAYDPTNANWWKRNFGLLALSMGRMGVPARLLTVGPPLSSDSPPHLQVSENRLRDTGWWRSTSARVFVWGAGNAPRWIPVASAARAAGLRVIQAMDADGILEPRGRWLHYFMSSAGAAHDAGQSAPWLRGFARTCWHAVAPRRILHTMVRYLEPASAAYLVSPAARDRVREFLARHGRADLAARVHYVPHPVTEDMTPGPERDRPRTIAAVGRWDACQKNTPLLMRVLEKFLAQQPDYRARIAGGGANTVAALAQSWPTALRARLDVLGPVPHDELPALYRTSRVLLMSSRWESFHIAAAEALCCGCSVVCPAHLPTASLFTDTDSGTVAARAAPDDLLAAMDSETRAWDDGARDPLRIAARFGSDFHARAVARRLVELGSEDPA